MLVIILRNDIEMENEIKAINKDGREEDKIAITNLLGCILFVSNHVQRRLISEFFSIYFIGVFYGSCQLMHFIW